MDIFGLRNGRESVLVQPHLAKSFKVVEGAKVNRGPIGVTKLKGVIIVFYPAIQIIKMEFECLAAVEVYNWIAKLVSLQEKLDALYIRHQGNIRKLSRGTQV